MYAPWTFSVKIVIVYSTKYDDYHQVWNVFSWKISSFHNLDFLHCDMYPLSSLMFGWANVIFDVTLKNNGLILRFVRHYFKSASMPTTSYQRSILIMISFCIMTVILSHLWDVQCRKILTFYKWRWTITSRSLRVVSFDRLCIISRSFFSQ